MKNTIKLKAIQRIAALIVLAMAVACPVFAKGAFEKKGAAKPVASTAPAAEPSTITITGLDAYNGMFIMVKTHGLDAEGIQAGGRIVERVSPFHGGTERAV